MIWRQCVCGHIESRHVTFGADGYHHRTGCQQCSCTAFQAAEKKGDKANG